MANRRLAQRIPSPAAFPPPILPSCPAPQLLVESRVSHRDPPPQQDDSQFYKETAMKDPKEVRRRHRRRCLGPQWGSLPCARLDPPTPSPGAPPQWDADAIRGAREDLLRQLADPERRMLGQGQVEDVAADVRQSGACARLAGPPPASLLPGAKEGLTRGPSFLLACRSYGRPP